MGKMDSFYSAIPLDYDTIRKMSDRQVAEASATILFESTTYADNLLLDNTVQPLVLGKFTEFLDPNRTAIHPVGSGSSGLVWYINYDDDYICSHGNLAGAMLKYCLIAKLNLFPGET